MFQSDNRPDPPQDHHRPERGNQWRARMPNLMILSELDGCEDRHFPIRLSRQGVSDMAKVLSERSSCHDENHQF